MKKISIVTAYYNRKELFYNTLLSIARSSIKDLEVIAVDDASDEEHRLEDLTTKFPFLKIIRIEPRDKWYTNPCIPFNQGFNQAEGDIVIIQNPECYHSSDILKYALENVTEQNYITFGCYSLDKEKTDLLNTNNTPEFLESISPLNNHVIRVDGELGWYNHPTLRPVGFHFCSAISKTNLNKLNGFDERYASGIAFDDNEFLCRVKRIPLEVIVTENPIVLHQNHYHITGSPYTRPDLVAKNKNLYYNVTKNEKIVTVNLKNENI